MAQLSLSIQNLLLLALLIGNAAGGFASALAGSLAFAATTVFGAFAKVLRLKSIDSAHGVISS